MVRGVHRPQAIVLLQSHISSENLRSLTNQQTTPFWIVCPAYFARAHTCYDSSVCTMRAVYDQRVYIPQRRG